MVPIRIVATMAEPIVYPGDGMHFDGPLAYGAYRALDDRTRRRMDPISSPWALDFRLPLARWVYGDLPDGGDDRLLDPSSGLMWGWHCSAAHADWLGQSAHYVRRPPAVAGMVRYSEAGSVATTGGRYKAQNKRLPSVFASSVVWYAVGDAALVLALLTLVPSIGKLGAHGLGAVQRWDVDDWHSDWSIERDGALTRRMPEGYPADGHWGMGGIRSPYHHPSRQVPCVEPDYMELRP